MQDRDGIVPLLKMCRGQRPFVRVAHADSAYASPHLAMTTSIGVETVRKFADQTGFVVHPPQWVVERVSGWLNRHRHLAKYFEQTIRSAAAFLYAASAMLLIRRLVRFA